MLPLAQFVGAFGGLDELVVGETVDQSFGVVGEVVRVVVIVQVVLAAVGATRLDELPELPNFNPLRRFLIINEVLLLHFVIITVSIRFLFGKLGCTLLLLIRCILLIQAVFIVVELLDFLGVGGLEVSLEFEEVVVVGVEYGFFTGAEFGLRSPSVVVLPLLGVGGARTQRHLRKPGYLRITIVVLVYARPDCLRRRFQSVPRRILGALLPLIDLGAR